MNDRVEISFHRLLPHEDADIPLLQYMSPPMPPDNGIAVPLETPPVLVSDELLGLSARP
jgi:hypothetical protein